MESDSTKLNNIFTEIQILCSEFYENKGPMKLETKISYYNKSNLLINEANDLIKKIQTDIQTILDPKKEFDNDMSVDKHLMNNVDTYISMLTKCDLNMKELFDIITILQRITPTTNKVNITDCDVFYEETNVDTF